MGERERDKLLKRVRDLHAMMMSGNPEESDIAKRKLLALLKEHNKTENDVDALLAEYAVREAAKEEAKQPPPDRRDAGDPYAGDSSITSADLVHHVLERYVALESHGLDAVTLWTIHTHCFDQFMHTPRLLLTSPTKSCGKTTLLDVMSSLVARAHRSGNITSAVLYHRVNRSRSTMLLDEVDNLDLETRKTLLGVLNEGHRKGGSVDRMIKGESIKFTVFAPVALAGIGLLPPPLMSRCIIIRMQKHDDWPLQRFDRADVDAVADLDTVFRHVNHWSASVQLNRDPKMPPELRGRVADNWRPLISIADAISPAWGERARAAAVKFAAAVDLDEEPGIVLLQHLLAIFDARGAAVLASQVLVEALIDHDELWGAWRGARGDERPRKFKQGDLALLLRPFGIRSRKIWLTRDPPKQARGYRRADLEEVWRSYRVEPGTPEQPSDRKYLRSVPFE